MKKTLLLLLAASLLLFQCSKDNDAVQPKKLHPLPKLTITDATSLVVYKGDNNARLSGTLPSNLFKITPTGSVEQVNLVNSDGTPIESDIIEVSYIIYDLFNINDDYVLMQGSFTAWDTLGNEKSYRSLAVRKSDGAIFDYGDTDWIFSPFYNWGMPAVQHDINGNAYGSNNYYGVTKISTDENGTIQKSEYLYSGQKQQQGFVIDSQGNCVYSDFGATTLKVRKKSGGLYEYANEYYDYWVGSNGKIYFSAPTQQEFGSVGSIRTISVNNDNTVTIDTVWTAETYDPLPLLKSGSTHLIKKSKSVVFVGLSGQGIWEFFEDTNTLNKHEAPSFTGATKIVSSANYIYIASGTKLYKVPLNDFTSTLLINEGQYEIYTMNVDNNELLQFSALRYSDGKKILGQIDANGVFTLIDEKQDRPATTLQRLN